MRPATRALLRAAESGKGAGRPPPQGFARRTVAPNLGFRFGKKQAGENEPQPSTRVEPEERLDHAYRPPGEARNRQQENVSNISSGQAGAEAGKQLRGMLSLQKKIGEVGKQFRARRLADFERERDTLEESKMLSHKTKFDDENWNVDDYRNAWKAVGRQNQARQERWAVSRLYLELLEHDWEQEHANRKMRAARFFDRIHKLRTAERKALRARIREERKAAGSIPWLSPGDRAAADGSGVYFSDFLFEETYGVSGLRPVTPPGAALGDEDLLKAVGAPEGVTMREKNSEKYDEMVAAAHRAERLARNMAVVDPMEIPHEGLEGGIHNFGRVVNNNATYTNRQKQQLALRFKRDMAAVQGKKPVGHNAEHGFRPSL